MSSCFDPGLYASKGLHESEVSKEKGPVFNPHCFSFGRVETLPLTICLLPSKHNETCDSC